MIIANPKRPLTCSDSTKASWFNYYAGYSDAFVADVLRKLPLDTESILADPWNGAGTTTQIAHERGLACYGFDINPAMMIVAKAVCWAGASRPVNFG